MVVQQNPQALNQVLSAIHHSDPSLINLIAEHQEEFVRMLQEPTGLPDMSQFQPPATGGAGSSAQLPAGPPSAAPGQPPMDPVAAMMAALAAGGAPAGVPAPAPAPAPAPVPAAPPVQLSPAEEQAVGRLQSLGFERMVALQAFLACERNE